MTDPNHPVYKVYHSVLQLSVLVFTLALVYFAFVYYPKVVREYKSGSIPASRPAIAPPVSAITADFPIETKNFRIVFDDKAGTYYVFVSGGKLDAFLINRNSATLTLKNALRVDSLCGMNVIYASSENINIPAEYKTDPNCK